MLRFIRKMVAGLRTRKGPSRLPESDEELQRGFKLRYLQFKRILNANDKVLYMMAEMEEGLQGRKPFGMNFIRSRCALISANVYQIIQHLNSLASDGRYRPLHERFEDIQQKIGSLLDARPKTTEGSLVLDIRKLDKTMVESAGVKMANLGEIITKLKMVAPPGFVISSAAYHLFMTHNRLQEEIDRRIQAHDADVPNGLYELSSALQQRVIQASMPQSLVTEINKAVEAMGIFSPTGPTLLAVRSSAVNEDTRDASFAGQYRSLLNVNPRHLPHAYKEVVAGKYTPTAMAYRFHRGLRDEDAIMCVGCLQMVDASCGGVLYTRNPLNPRDETILIHAVWGLPGLVVDGRSSTDRFVLSRTEPLRLLSQEIARKSMEYHCLDEEGICRYPLDDLKSIQPSLKAEQALELGRLALRLDDYFGEPQDIEWAIDAHGCINILQCRPLRMSRSSEREAEMSVKLDTGLPVLLDGGVAASPGAATGPAHILKKEADKFQFKPGNVMVIRQSLPGYATLLDRAAAVIAEYGSPSSHLANVAREYGVPALFGVSGALDALHSGQVVTVDSEARRVYEGAIEGLHRKAREPGPLMDGTPVYRTLTDVSEHILPLTLIDADSPDFRPESCRTFHDILRYCHECAVREMFLFGRENEFPQRSSKQLLVEVPMKWWVLNLDDGFREEVEGRHVTLDNILSVPMLALWEGITLVPWEGPPPLDGKGFLSVMFEATRNTDLLPGLKSRYGERNYFMIAKNYCSLTSRFGFHFATVESYVGERVPENYIIFRFKGGAADDFRKHRRVNLIGEVLEEQDFVVSVAEDVLTARFEDYPMEVMQNRLKILGFLIMHTRQLDMVMSNDAMVAHYRNKMKTGIAGLSG